VLGLMITTINPLLFDIHLWHPFNLQGDLQLFKRIVKSKFYKVDAKHLGNECQLINLREDYLSGGLHQYDNRLNSHILEETTL
jgi:hypothetical protein